MKKEIIITCVLVKFEDGTESYVSLIEYKTSPTPNSFIVDDRRKNKNNAKQFSR